jgi:uncharacterized protein (DUF952 family)
VRIFHVATVSDWEAAQRSGFYVTSSLGKTLADEGFLHASREDQWRGVLDRFYAGVTEPLVLLTIDTDLLTSPWREDPVGDDTFPHIYGPLNPSAVVEAVGVAPYSPGAHTTPTAPAPAPATAPSRPVPAPGDRLAQPEGTFTQFFVGEVAFRAGIALLAMLLSVVGATIAKGFDEDAQLAGALIGLALGIAAGVVIAKRRRR